MTTSNFAEVAEWLINTATQLFTAFTTDENLIVIGVVMIVTFFFNRILRLFKIIIR